MASSSRQALAAATFFIFASGGAYVIITQMGRSSAEYGAWFALGSVAYMAGNLTSARLTPRIGSHRMIWIGLAIQIGGSIVTTDLGRHRAEREPGLVLHHPGDRRLRQRLRDVEHRRRRRQRAAAGGGHRIRRARLRADGFWRDRLAARRASRRRLRHHGAAQCGGAGAVADVRGVVALLVSPYEAKRA